MAQKIIRTPKKRDLNIYRNSSRQYHQRALEQAFPWQCSTKHGLKAWKVQLLWKMMKQEQGFWMQIKKKIKKKLFKHIVDTQAAKLWKCIMKSESSPFPCLLFECWVLSTYHYMELSQAPILLLPFQYITWNATNEMAQFISKNKNGEFSGSWLCFPYKDTLQKSTCFSLEHW